MERISGGPVPPEAWVEPLGLLTGVGAAAAVSGGMALPLAGGPAAFSLVRLIGDGRIVPIDRVPTSWQPALEMVSARRSWAGLAARPAVMGILNVTPDSFSDGGLHADPVAAARAMVAAGADLIDVGGESTRPGSGAVPVAVELDRVLPVIEALGAEGIAVSVDTRNATTMAATVAAGARIVNDVSALVHDPAAPGVVAGLGCPVVLMHMRGEPATMTQLTQYKDVALDVARELAMRVQTAEQAGIRHDSIAVDPGIGFAKTAEQNLDLLNRLPLLLNLGCPILVGVSRKGFVGRFGGEPDPRRRAPGSIAAALHALDRGAAVVRVHDVTETVQAIGVWRALNGLA